MAKTYCYILESDNPKFYLYILDYREWHTSPPEPGYEPILRDSAVTIGDLAQIIEYTLNIGREEDIEYDLPAEPMQCSSYKKPREFTKKELITLGREMVNRKNNPYPPQLIGLPNQDELAKARFDKQTN